MRKNMNIEGALMNGAGMVKSLEDVVAAAESKADIVLVGSVTPERRMGNGERTYSRLTDPMGTINSIGLRNLGMPYYVEHSPAMIDICHANDKQIMISLAGETDNEYLRMAETARKLGFDGVELNFGCPNAWKEGMQAEITSFNINHLGSILSRFLGVMGMDFFITAKLSPYSDPLFLAKIAEVIRESPVLKAITTCNTFPNAFAFDDENKQAVRFGQGYGGYAGEGFRPIVMGQVKQFRNHLTDLPIIAVGGVTQKKHVDEYGRVGATAVQVASGYMNEGPRIFDRLVD